MMSIEGHDRFMRELLYLSQRKLRQFDLGHARWRGVRARVTGEIKVPGFGGVTVGNDGDGPKAAVPDLDKVIAALEGSDRASHWFTEDVGPGQWVQFEAPMSYAVTDRGGVIFLDLDQRTPSYPTGGDVRLMLHGSSRHIVGSEPPAQEVTDRQIDAAMGFSAGNPRHLLTKLLMDLASADEPLGQSASIAIKRVEHKLPGSYAHLIQVLNRKLDLSHTAAWMAGYARITAVPPPVNGSRIVVATPLYVEYVSAPAMPA
ncbi:MAG TPA: SAVMC3_10250 family protein [Amycolatopsis sp.]|uniref:SAVMC3_10250 family protein n=1 Tax=Amycolatopsis sp. TaxID=37632 RepID=UPI002B46D00E|nr:SAVMC3_10250 family protein [Amycolatopsis sp.]HKS45801.1 SAVMC3_10250 family protein [Amycolatopsis sp.]